MAISAMAQAAQTISGSLIENGTNQPLEYANVQLLSAKDSSLVSGTITDETGAFSIKNVPQGQYILRMTYIGFRNKDRRVKVGTKDVRLGKIAMEEDSQMLKGVTVVGQAAPVVVKNDTIEFNSSAYRVPEGAALEELVKKLPGAEISKEGKLMVNGKEVKKILVDGKEFFSDDPKVSLKNLPANMVEKVKTYDKKSDNAIATGIDDDDDETVLDLTVKKGMKKGWFGNAMAGAGNKERYEAAVMMSRFTDDSNLSILGSANNTNNTGFSEFGDANFGRQNSSGAGITSSKLAGATFAQDYKNTEFGGSVRYGYSDNDARKLSSTERILYNGSNHRNDTTNTRRKRDDLNLNLRFKWKPDSMSTLTFTPNLTYSDTKSESNNASSSRGIDDNLQNTKHTGSQNDGNNLSLNGTLRYNRKLDKPGRNFSAMAKYSLTHSAQDVYSNSITNFFFDEDEWADSLLQTDRYTDKGSDSKTIGMELSLTEPIFRNHSLQVKYGLQYRTSTSESYSYDQLTDKEYYVDSLSSHVKNNYLNHNAEVSLQGRYEKLTYNAGVTLQPQYSESQTSVGPNAGRDLSQSVFNFGPNIRLRYKFSQRNALNFNYRGRSSAPDIESLQDVIDQDDPLDLKFGNPDLKPSFTNNLRLRYSNYNTKKQRNLMANVSYSNTINSVTNKTIYNTTTGGKETYKVNVNGNWNTSGNILYSAPLKNRKFNLSNNLNGSYAERPLYSTQKVAGTALPETEKSKTKSSSIGDKLTLSYRTDQYDASLFASALYSETRNKVQAQNNRSTTDYTFGGDANVSLPWNMTLSSDFNYDIHTGYSDGYDDNEFIWNAQIAKNFLKNNAATIRLKIYDLLQQRSNLTRSVTDTEISDIHYNTLSSYFMIHFVYRVNTLGARAAREAKEDKLDNDRPRPERGEGRQRQRMERQ